MLATVSIGAAEGGHGVYLRVERFGMVVLHEAGELWSYRFAVSNERATEIWTGETHPLWDSGKEDPLHLMQDERKITACGFNAKPVVGRQSGRKGGEVRH